MTAGSLGLRERVRREGGDEEGVARGEEGTADASALTRWLRRRALARVVPAGSGHVEDCEVPRVYGLKVGRALILRRLAGMMRNCDLEVNVGVSK